MSEFEKYFGMPDDDAVTFIDNTSLPSLLLNYLHTHYNLNSTDILKYNNLYFKNKYNIILYNIYCYAR